ncbi:MAG: hypothetical protein NT107_10345 [Planctomycetota bacterium]|nr:hypothetical protein [Planctomycetota bacterium]
MGHIAVSAPGIEHFQLLERTTRELRARGHRVTMLCLDSITATFWAAQGLPVALVRRETAVHSDAPLRAYAEDDCLRGNQSPTGRRLASAEARLAQLIPGINRFLLEERPSLILLHQIRSGSNQLVHYLARQALVKAVWTGAGLLPHTLFLDNEGLDGKSLAALRSAHQYRAVAIDEPFLDAALTAVLGHNQPAALARRMVQPPTFRNRLRDAVAGLFAGNGQSVLAAFTAWQRAQQPAPAQNRNSNLPADPFVAVLLQRDDDDRLRIDCKTAPSNVALVGAVLEAVQTTPPLRSVVAVLPQGGLRRSEMAQLRRMVGIRIECTEARHVAAATAAAIVTINDPTACTGLLAGTPVVHLGVAVFGIPGIATHGRLESLASDLAAALQNNQPTLRQRCLTWLLRNGHVWCSPEQPDHNGISGLVLALESSLGEQNVNRARLRYRPGPAWPLAAEATP